MIISIEAVKGDIKNEYVYFPEEKESLIKAIDMLEHEGYNLLVRAEELIYSSSFRSVDRNKLDRNIDKCKSIKNEFI